MVDSANLGFPRIGAKRTLKKALEAYWKGDIDETALRDVGAKLRAHNWKLQKEAGINHIPSNDFSFYDQVLDTTMMLGAIPKRFQHLKGLEAYFAMARGTDAAPAMEMTKWFDTNYHYLVPEFSDDLAFSTDKFAPLDAFIEAQKQGIHTRPVLIGPVTWLTLGKSKTEGLDPLSLLPTILPIYAKILSELAKSGATWVQIDEPILVQDLTPAQSRALKSAYDYLSGTGPDILLATYFGGLDDNLALATGLKVQGLHIDLVRAPSQIDNILENIGDKFLSLGLIDGRNIWRTDLDAALDVAAKVVAAHGSDRVQIAPSCSLLHVPVDLAEETKLDAETKSWLAFARQKLDEIKALAVACDGDKETAQHAFDIARAAIRSRAKSSKIHDQAVKNRTANITQSDQVRQSPFKTRSAAQHALLDLPAFPTTSIGSFPQTQDIRQARANFKKGSLSDADYTTFLRERTIDCIRRQEALDLDVLVHGEFERNDMVEYFGERLSGFFFTKNGWVQSYGSRCVKPPVIYGDVSRPAPMTVDWATFAQSQTNRPMKGMLTGPVTILNWSFVRDDQPRSETCKQIGLAIRDEVEDLEKAGLKIIQIDEAALREGLPLRRADWQYYLDWAVGSFRLAASVAADTTQIHTHMCYSEFNDIMPAIADMDADVISIETSRSDMELLEVFRDFDYPNDIGPGVWDIHSPRVPAKADMTALLQSASGLIPAERLWVNPDCGLKTRGWPEVEKSLDYLVQSAKIMRKQIAPPQQIAQ